MKAILAILVIVLAVDLCHGLDWAGNVTLANPEEFNYRATTYGVWNVLVAIGGWFASFSANTLVPGSASADVVFAACDVRSGLGNASTPGPSAWLAYFDVAAQAANSGLGLSNNINWAQVDISAAGGYIAQTFINVTEKDASGNVVNVIRLGPDLFWTQSAQGAANDLYYVTYQAQQILKGTTYTVTYAVSSTYGVLNDVANTLITPKSLESWFTISNYQYASPTNHLTLTTGVASGSATWDGSGKVASGSGSNRVYYKVAKTASTNLGTTPVSFTYVGGADLNAIFKNPDLRGQITSKYGGQASGQIVTVMFPPGASQITYDPTLGAGADAQVMNSAGRVVGGVLTFVLILVLLF